MPGYWCMCLSIGIGLMLARLDDAPVVHTNWRSRVVQASAFILSPKMRLRLLLVVMVIALVLTRSRMGNAAFFAAMLIVGSIAIVLARKTAPKTIALIASLLGLGLLGALVALTLWTVLAVLARRRSRLPRGMAFGVAMSIVALLIHSAVDFNLQIPANAPALRCTVCGCGCGGGAVCHPAATVGAAAVLLIKVSLGH